VGCDTDYFICGWGTSRLMATTSQFSDVVLTRQSDPTVVASLRKGRFTCRCSASVTHDGCQQRGLYDIQLSNVVVTSDSNASAGSSNILPSENLSLRYDFVSWTYTILTGLALPGGKVAGVLESPTQHRQRPGPIPGNGGHELWRRHR